MKTQLTEDQIKSAIAGSSLDYALNPTTQTEQRDTTQHKPTSAEIYGARLKTRGRTAWRNQERDFYKGQCSDLRAHAERLAEALRQAQDYIVNGKSGADQRYAHRVVAEALMNWQNPAREKGTARAKELGHTLVVSAAWEGAQK